MAAPWPDDHVLDGLEELGHLVFTNYVPASGPLVRRSCHDEIGCYEASLPHAGDWDLWLRLCTRYRAGYLARALYGYRMHGTNMPWLQDYHVAVSQTAAGQTPTVGLRLRDLVSWKSSSVSVGKPTMLGSPLKARCHAL